MAETQEAMLPMVVWWHENQVAVTFLSMEPFDAGAKNVIRSLHLDRLNQFLNDNGFNLTSFNDTDVPHPLSSDVGEEPGETLVQEGIEVLGKGVKEIGEGVEALGEKIEGIGEAIHDSVEKEHDGGNKENRDDDEDQGLNSPTGKYLLLSPSGEGTSVVTFFHVERTNSGQSKVMAASSSGMEMKDGIGETDGKGMYYENDDTLKVVGLLNSNLDELKSREVPIVSSMPHWLSGGTGFGCGTHGCPTCPPIPVPDTCPSSPGSWPIMVNGKLPEATGENVMVFVLDTLPEIEQITTAASHATTNNQLLMAMTSGMVSTPPFAATPPAINVNYNILPDSIDKTNPEQPATGKDIYGCLVGFAMEDHGLFVGGIVRSIAPQAKIEIIRVLNDVGAGDTATLISALTDIQNRLMREAVNPPIVINLSLVATPPDEVLAKDPYDLKPEDIKPIRDGLRVPIESLANNSGVVFVASAGNDSDLRDICKDMSMDMSGMRLQARYPAYFAYDNPSGPGISQVIPVGAVKKNGDPTSYSNYPGEDGIATYGGEIPTPIPSTPQPGGTTLTDPEIPIDALRGVYSAPYYPKLAVEDSDESTSYTPPPPAPPQQPPYPLRDAPQDSNAWAYWSGTSFATPIISAVAALFLEGQQPKAIDVRQTILNAAVEQTTWDRLEPSNGTTSGPLIMARQCQQLSEVE